MALKILPNIGIIYSESDEGSNESKNLAHLICGHLVMTKYAKVFMIGMPPDGSPLSQSLPNNKRIKFLPTGTKKEVEIPAADVTFGHWNILENCHVIIVTTNGEDTSICVKKLKETFENKKVVAFAMQRGVRSCSAVKEGLSGIGGSVVVECVVGFAAVTHPTTGVYMSTIPSGGFVFERLTKEITDAANGPVSLMECMNFDILYRKTLTPFAWGILIYENLYALNAIAGGTVHSTLMNPLCRKMYAAMIRENYKALKKAARGGQWKPEFTLISNLLTPWLVEMILVLPQPLFSLTLLILGFPSVALPGPGLQDLLDGRKTATSSHLNELLLTSKRNNSFAPVSECVLEKLRAMESSTVLPRDRGGSPQHLSDLEALVRQNAGGAVAIAGNSVSELQYWLVRGLTALSFIMVFYFLIFHE